MKFERPAPSMRLSTATATAALVRRPRHSRAQPWANDRLVAAHRGFHQRSLAVAGCFLPIQPTPALDHEQVHVAHRRICLKLCAGLRCRARRDDDFDLWIVLRNGLVGRITVIGAIGRDLANSVFDLVEQWPNLGRVIDVLLRQY